MTVGIAALAEGDKALVLCSDRQYTTEEGLRHEGRIAKKREIGFGWRFLVADNSTRADQVESEVQKRLREEHADRSDPMTAAVMIPLVQEAFLEVRRRTFAAGLLSDDDHFDLELLVAGFDPSAARFICVRFFENGDYEDIRLVGYGAIGAGDDVAEGALAHYKIAINDDPLWQVMYKVYEAKRRADKFVTSVGETTDMWVITPHEERHSTLAEPGPSELLPPVPKRIIDVLEGAFKAVSTPPWEHQKREVPPDWQRFVTDYTRDVLAGKRVER